MHASSAERSRISHVHITNVHGIFQSGDERASVMHTNNNGRLILIVEDHLSIAEMLGGFFEAGGYEVDFARDGAEALRLSANNPYDAILLDRNLPRIDGVEVCRRIRQEQRRATPILMLTARDSIEDRVEGLEAGRSE